MLQRVPSADKNFVHLHVHSHYSLLDGLPKIGQLVKTAKKRGFSALALTDYASLYGVIDFYKKAHDEGIKPIIGCDIWLEPEGAEKSGSRLLLLVQNDADPAIKNIDGYTALDIAESKSGKERDEELVAFLRKLK